MGTAVAAVAGAGAADRHAGEVAQHQRHPGLSGHRAYQWRLHQGRRHAVAPRELTVDRGHHTRGDGGTLRVPMVTSWRPACAPLWPGRVWGLPAVEEINEKTTEEASCIVNRYRTHQATAGNPCLPRCSDIYV